MKMITHKRYYTSLRRHNWFAPRKCQPWTLPQPIIVEIRDTEAKSNKTTFISDLELITEMLKIRRQFYSTLGVGILSGTHATCNNTSPGWIYRLLHGWSQRQLYLWRPRGVMGGERPRWLYEDDSHFRPTRNKWAARNISLNDFLNAAAVVDETSNLRAMSQAVFQTKRLQEWLTSVFLAICFNGMTINKKLE